MILKYQNKFVYSCRVLVISSFYACIHCQLYILFIYLQHEVFFDTEADMKREIERKEQERKKSQKIDFIPGGTQPGTVPPAPKISTQIPGTDFKLL